MSSKVMRAAAMAALASAAGVMAALTAAGPATAAPARGPEPVSTRLTAVNSNTSSWVNIYWRSDTPVCDAQVRVDGGRQVRIAYPGMRRTTTFTRGNALRPGRTAATPVQVSPNVRNGGIVLLRAVMSYDDCGRHARTQFKRVNLALPVLRNFGPGMPGQHVPGPHTPGQHLPGQQDPGQHNPGQHNPGQHNPGMHPGDH
jgi:hypothetical protein